MISFKNVLRKLDLYSDRHGIENALALHRRGEVRRDGLTLTRACHHLEIEWRARDIHPWDRDCEPSERELEFTEQSLADTDAALSRLFKELPEVDVIEFRVIRPDSDVPILAGKVERSAPMPRTRGASPRTRLWHRGVTITLLAATAFVLFSETICAQTQATTASQELQASSTSANLFVMCGSDFDGTRLPLTANYFINIWHAHLGQPLSQPMNSPEKNVF
jgi:hypothetical protein